MQKSRRGTSPPTRSNSATCSAGQDLPGCSSTLRYGSRQGSALRGGSSGHERPPGALEPLGQAQRQNELEEMVDVRVADSARCILLAVHSAWFDRNVIV
jgi:hypothetical protein